MLCAGFAPDTDRLVSVGRKGWHQIISVFHVSVVRWFSCCVSAPLSFDICPLGRCFVFIVVQPHPSRGWKVFPSNSAGVKQSRTDLIFSVPKFDEQFLDVFCLGLRDNKPANSKPGGCVGVRFTAFGDLKSHR
jgi:hypothetical protein